MTEYNIFIIEDDRMDYQRLEKRMEEFSIQLKAKCEIEFDIDGVPCWETLYESFIECYIKRPIDIILLDYELEWKNGLENNGIQVINEIARKTKGPYPFIIYTSGRFDTNRKALEDFTFAENGMKFFHKSIRKRSFFDENENDKILGLIQRIISNTEKRICLNLIEYPFNIKTHKNSQDYSIKALLSSTTPKGDAPKEPSPYRENETVRESQVIALLANGNDHYGLLHIERGEIVLSMLKVRSKSTMADVHGFFTHSKISLQKASGRSLSFNPEYLVEKAYKKYGFLQKENLTKDMIDTFMKKRDREIYHDARHVPFHDIFKILVSS